METSTFENRTNKSKIVTTKLSVNVIKPLKWAGLIIITFCNSIEAWDKEICGLKINNVTVEDGGFWRLTSKSSTNNKDVARGIAYINVQSTFVNLITCCEKKYTKRLILFWRHCFEAIRKYRIDTWHWYNTRPNDLLLCGKTRSNQSCIATTWKLRVPEVRQRFRREWYLACCVRSERQYAWSHIRRECSNKWYAIL